ncbi:uncharacterized protein LOC110628658 isoform X2 [Manihot esculenta]|nr:uncharacterized protein LOC110628658 isoform X2 [Manihot esculenta]XP_021631140.1 uncharacterized protein LOC110628658 isoform X2 [Manihot esculenta]KAG8641947.1 hypothetical protein MANES_12G045900v8 [Manihot esculenta]KAG8641948.1 hypothetical protein MANES_12G045900v8 [Manihot esculenta]
MSAFENRRGLAGLSLDDVLAAEKEPAVAVSHTSAQVNRTLLDIIRDDENHGPLFGSKDRKSWKVFRDRLRLKRTGSAWVSTIPTPASDIPIRNNHHSSGNPRSFMTRHNSGRMSNISSNSGDSTHPEDSNDNPAVPSFGPQMSRRSSGRFSSLTPSESGRHVINAYAAADEASSRSFMSQMSRPNSIGTSDSFLDGGEELGREGSRRLGAALAEERAISAREAVVAQQAAEAAAAAQAAGEAATAEEEEEEEGSDPAGGGAAEPVRMSLMDLLETEGSRYITGEGEEYEEEEEEDEEDTRAGGDGIEHTCCVCMVRHKGAAFIPCGHTFCRLCSRELWVQRGNCPLCNGFILEILDIF